MSWRPTLPSAHAGHTTAAVATKESSSAKECANGQSHQHTLS